jgi:hypothetical protein
MGFNRRKLQGQRHEAAEKDAAARRATDAQVLEDATGQSHDRPSGSSQRREIREMSTPCELAMEAESGRRIGIRV